MPQTDSRTEIFLQVETVGDCYVAVAGLPNKMKTHAPTMCRFAKDIQSIFQEVVWKLQVTLGPDTAVSFWRCLTYFVGASLA